MAVAGRLCLGTVDLIPKTMMRRGARGTRAQSAVMKEVSSTTNNDVRRGQLKRD